MKTYIHRRANKKHYFYCPYCKQEIVSYSYLLNSADSYRDGCQLCDKWFTVKVSKNKNP